MSINNRSVQNKTYDSIERNVMVSLMVFLVYTLFAYYFKAIHVEEVFSLMIRIEGLLCIPLFIYTFQKYKGAYSSATHNWTVFIIFYMLFETVNSYVFNSEHDQFLSELVFWIFFLAVFYIGSSRLFWPIFFKWCVIILIITSFLSFLELYFSNFSYFRGEWDENSYLYQIQIGFTPLLLFLCYYLMEKQKKGILFSIGIFVFYVILQFYFQKRLPLVRCMLFLILLFYVMRKKVTLIKVLPINTLIVSVIVIGVVKFVPKDYGIATIDRFQKGGSLTITTSQDERYLILEKAMEITFSDPRTALFGQGIGGIVKGDFYGKTIVDSRGNEVNGLSSFEVGAAFIIFKYGLVFFLVMYGCMARLLFDVKKYRNDSIAMSCWLYLLVFFIMSIVGESFPNIHTTIGTVTLAASMGYLSSFKKRCLLRQGVILH